MSTQVGSSRATVRRAGWGVADQAVSSLTNFAIVVVAARALTLDEFGAVSVALAVYAVALGIVRAMAGEPLVVCHSATTPEQAAGTARGALATALGLGIVGAAGLVVVGASVGGDLGAALVALALVLPGLVVQDTWRFTFFALGRARSAFANDTVWFLGLAVGLLAFPVDSIPRVVLAWGAAAGVAALLACVQARLLPAARRVRPWLGDHAHLWPRYVSEFLTVSAGWHAALLGLGVVAGVAAVGTLRAGQVLVGPLNVAFLAVPLVAVPESARLWRAGHGAPARHGVWISAALASLALGWGCVVAVLPASVGQSLLGSAWTDARSILLPVSVVMVVMGVNLGSFCALRVLGAARESLGVRLVSTPVVLVMATVGGAVDGARGAAWGWALAAGLAAPLWVRAVRRVSAVGTEWEDDAVDDVSLDWAAGTA